MKKLIITFLAMFCFTADAPAQCGSQTRFPRTRTLVARFVPLQPVFPRLRAVVASPRLVGLSGGCLPVFEVPATVVVPAAKPMTPIVPLKK